MRKTAVSAAGLALSASLAGLLYAAPASGATATEKSAVAPTASAPVSRTAVDDHGRGRSRADDPAGHELGNDHRGRSGRPGRDDPAGHDADDDRGSGGHGSHD